tara:strand:+ start:149 stop:610 length:462 start_codon:yes stop_codon:yes gene_type:complete
MSKNNNEVVVAISKFPIVQKIMETFKLGDGGKLDSFFTRIDKTLSREIAAHEKNIENNKFNSKTVTEGLQDDLEDAEQRLAEAFMAVEPENVDTNQKASGFVDAYLEGISKAEKAVERIEEEIKDEATSLKDKNADLAKQVKLLKRRIASITA